MKKYIGVWKARCYFDDLPDEVERNLEQSGRVPSYRHIAMQILRGDLKLHGLGFNDPPSQYYYALKKHAATDKQLSLF